MQTIPARDVFLALLGSPDRLLAGYQQLQSRMLDDDKFLRQTIEYLSEEQTSKESFTECFHVLTLLHPPLICVFSDLSPGLQEDIRGGLLNIVLALHTDLRCVGALALIIREIIEMDSLQPWLEPFGELLKWIASDELTVMEAGIEFFLSLLRQTPYNQQNCELPLHRLAPLLLSNLFQIFAHSELTEQVREKLLYLVLQLIKTFSIFDGSQDNIVRECFDDTYQIWMSLFVSTIQSSLTSNLIIKRYIMKILVIIFRDMQKYLVGKQADSASQLYLIWEFAYKVMPLYLWVVVWDKPVTEFPAATSTSSTTPERMLYYDDDYDSTLSTVEALAHSVLEWLSVLTSMSGLFTIIRISIHLLVNVFFHFMMMTQLQGTTWKNNSHHFLLQNSMDYEVTVRGKILCILNELIEKFGDQAIEAVLLIAEKFLMNQPEQVTTETLTTFLKTFLDLKSLPEVTNQILTQAKLTTLLKLSSCDVRATLGLAGQSWRKLEVSLVVLGRFSEDIIVFQSKQPTSFSVQSFVKGLLRQISNDEYYSLLKGQSLYCLTRFTQIISIKYRTLFGELIVASALCLAEDYPLSVKIIAARAVTIFLRKIEKHQLEIAPQLLEKLNDFQPIDKLMALPLTSDVISLILQALIEICKNKNLSEILNRPSSQYMLTIFHTCLNQNSALQVFFTLLQCIAKDPSYFTSIVNSFVNFAEECFKVYDKILQTDQKKHMKALDIELILTVLRSINILVDNCTSASDKLDEKARLLSLLPSMCDILERNDDVQIHLAASVYLKNLIKVCNELLLENSSYVQRVMKTIRNLLKIPTDKSFESASIYVGNLTLLAFDKLKQHNYEILQQIVLKVFKSRTPSVIQSLVLVYARMFNLHTTAQNKFTLGGEVESNARKLIDFLSSFSIENRMGLKILVDKWLLQQSLFRGRHTKVSTFMALSKLFLLNDKRVDNLLVIGFNPSHTNVCNDVTTPLKIMATLIRCLDNELGGQNRKQEEEQQYSLKEEAQTVEVNLQKFREQKQEEQSRGGLADRQNQQGSTCYMSAMLQFYDDGEECDDKTEEDLIHLQDCSVNFDLGEYLREFFNYLAAERTEYFKGCLSLLLKEDTRTLQKYIKLH